MALSVSTNVFGYRPDVKISEVLANTKFTLSAEIVPPRNGAEQSKVIDQIRALVDAGAQFLSVTKGAGGSLRGGSLPIAQTIKENVGVPCIAHFTCRDITPQEAENQLMDHHYFGVRNILALRGDPPAGQPNWKAHDGSHKFAHELIRQIRDLNQGRFLPRPGISEVANQVEQTDFCIGCAAHPEHSNEAEGIAQLRNKIESGAEFAITQMIFDPERYARFRDKLRAEKVEIPILIGTRVVRNREQALKMHELFNVTVPQWVLDQLPSEQERAGDRPGLELFIKLIERFQELGAPGVHLFVLNDTKLPSAFLQAVKKR